MNDHDEREIIRLINRYGIAMDAQRWDLFDTIFTEDVELDYSGMVWNTLPVVKADFAVAHEGFDATQHGMLNHLIDSDGERASAFTYCNWRLIRHGVEGGNFLEGTAWFDDALVRTGAGWRIARRVCRILWTDGNPQVIGAAEAMPTAALRSEADAGRVGYLESLAKRAAVLQD